MIRHLRLRNWRSYEDVELDFTRGTTFIVASNGIGKTSLIEAARWALFGEQRFGVYQAVRKGAPSATARVVLELPDGRELAVERVLPAKPRGVRPDPVVWLADVQIDPIVLEAELSKAYGGRAAFLAGVTMPALGRDDGPAGLGTEEHLGQYFGVDSLRELIQELDGELGANAKHVKQVKSDGAVAAGELDRLNEALEEASRRVESATAMHDTFVQRRERRLRWDSFRRELSEVRQANTRAELARAEVAERARAALPTLSDPAHLEDGLGAEIEACDLRLHDLRVALAVNTSRIELLEVNQERLDSAHDDCPVCRRPLDPQTVVTATESRVEESGALRSANDELSAVEREVGERRERLVALLAAWRAVPPSRGVTGTPQVADETVPLEELDAMTQRALDELVEARARSLQAEAARDESVAANQAMRKLTGLFRRQAALRVVQETAKSTLGELLEGTVRPLASELDQRWQALFPGRGAVETPLDGRVSRTIGEHSLPYDSFSTGEGTSLTILFRLLVAQMVTSVDFCWFDEPLEHLDPDTRRRVASMLSRVTVDGGPVKQVVVTTYEEPLARLLQARDHENVRLLDVRQS